MADADSPQDESAETEASERLQHFRDLVARYPREFHDYRFLLDWMDRYVVANQQLSSRVVDLINANTRLVSERNVARGRADHFEASVDWLLRHNGIQQLRRLEAENRSLIEERDEARHQLHQAKAAIEINRDAADRLKTDGRIADAARVFFQWLADLENHRDKMETAAMAASLLTAWDDLKTEVVRPPPPQRDGNYIYTIKKGA